jgi:hypothetical protein
LPLRHKGHPINSIRVSKRKLTLRHKKDIPKPPQGGLPKKGIKNYEQRTVNVELRNFSAF